MLKSQQLKWDWSSINILLVPKRGSHKEDVSTLSQRKESDRAKSNMQNLGNCIKVIYCENS